MATPETNNRPVTMSVLADKLETIRADQRTEHVRTRALVVIGALAAGSPTIAKGLALIGLHVPYLPTW